MGGSRNTNVQKARSTKKKSKGGFSCCKKKASKSPTSRTKTPQSKNARSTRSTTTRPTRPKSQMPGKPGPGQKKAVGPGGKLAPVTAPQANKSGQQSIQSQKNQAQSAKENSGAAKSKNPTANAGANKLLEDQMLKTAIPYVEPEEKSDPEQVESKRKLKKQKEGKKAESSPRKHRSSSDDSVNFLSDANQPEQSLSVKRYVRNGRVFVQWEYSESYPIDSHRPSFAKLLNTKPKNVENDSSTTSECCQCAKGVVKKTTTVDSNSSLLIAQARII